jgi:hypothetical protein
MLIYKYKSAFSSTFLVYFLESPKVSSQAMNNYNKYGFSDFVRRTQTLPFRIDVFSSFENFRLHQIKETNKPLKTYNLQTLFLEKVDKFKKQGKSINLSEPKAKPENNFKPDIPKRIDPSKAATMTPDEIKDIKNNKEKPTIAPKNSESKPKIEEKPKPKTEPTNKKTDTEIKNKTENKAVDKPKTEPKELNQPKLDKNQKPDITIKNKEKEIKEFKEKVKETNKEKNNPRNFREINVSEEIKKVKLEKQPIDSKTTQKPAKT